MGSQIVVTDTTTGKNVVLEIDENIEYVFNTSNIGDMSLSKSNYTEAFKIPRLSKGAVKTFIGLGNIADISGTPYVINEVDVLDNYAKVYSGNLVILKSTPEYYESTVISGTFDIFSKLGDKTFADIPEVVANLPLKTVQNVANLATVPKTPVIFAIANYGGITHVNDNQELSINVDCMPVAYEIRYLWDAIFRFIGIASYITGDVPNLTDQYYTFPYPPLNDLEAFGTIRYYGRIPQEYQNLPAANNPAPYAGWVNITQNGFTQIGSEIRCNVAGTYNFTFDKFHAYGQGNVNGNNILFPMMIILRKNGTEFFRFEASMNDTNTDKYYINTVQEFSVNDTLSIQAIKTVNIDSGAFWNFFQFDSYLRITNVEITNETIRNILNVKLSDYVKEFMYRFGLVGFATETGVVFKNMQNILEGTVVDWSDKYDRRVDETYDLGWNQNNYLRHKYVDANANYYDLNIITNNQNLAPTRDIIKSNVYVPSRNASLFTVSGNGSTVVQTNVRGYVTYSVDNSNNVKTENRNFWLEADPVVLSQVRFGSYQLPDRVTLNSANVYVSYNFTYPFSTSEVWKSMTKIVVGARMHTIELSLTPVDIATFTQWNLFYFKQESAYYMLSELRYKSGEKATGKFIKVNNIIYGQ